MTSDYLIARMQQEAKRILLKTISAAVTVVLTYFSVLLALNWMGLLLLVVTYFISLGVLLLTHKLKEDNPLLNVISLPAALIICAPLLVVQLITALYQQYKSLHALLPLILRKEGIQLLSFEDTELLRFQVKVPRSGTIINVEQQKPNWFVMKAYNTTSAAQSEALYCTSLGEVGLLLAHYE